MLTFDDDGGSWRTGIFVDLLLASCDIRTPIVGELKIRDDKDPFTALIQMLAGAVHLATTDQYGRLCEFLPAGAFPPTEQPRLDGYLLLYRFLETPQADLESLDRQADKLSALLMKRSEITTHLRRIACVDLASACRRQASRQLPLATRWVALRFRDCRGHVRVAARRSNTHSRATGAAIQTSGRSGSSRPSKSKTNRLAASRSGRVARSGSLG